MACATDYKTVGLSLVLLDPNEDHAAITETTKKTKWNTKWPEEHLQPTAAADLADPSFGIWLSPELRLRKLTMQCPRRRKLGNMNIEHKS